MTLYDLLFATNDDTAVAIFDNEDCTVMDISIEVQFNIPVMDICIEV